MYICTRAEQVNTSRTIAHQHIVGLFAVGYKGIYIYQRHKVCLVSRLDRQFSVAGARMGLSASVNQYCCRHKLKTGGSTSNSVWRILDKEYRKYSHAKARQNIRDENNIDDHSIQPECPQQQWQGTHRRGEHILIHGVYYLG